MNAVDLLLARAQVAIAHITTVGFFGLLACFMFVRKELDSTQTTILTSLISVLGTIWALQMNFFFARMRPQGLPDPVNGTTISTITAKTESIPPLVKPTEIVK